MPFSHRLALTVGAVLLIGADARAQQLPPVRALGPAERTSKDLLDSVIAVRALPDGRVLVSEFFGQRIVRFDSSLSSHDLAADAMMTDGTRQVWSTPGLIAYKGDSSLLLDHYMGRMQVLDGAGRPGRTIMISAPREASQLMGGMYCTPGFDARGRMVYREDPPVYAVHPSPSDTVALQAFDLAGRGVETLARVMRANVFVKHDTVISPEGVELEILSTHPLPRGDDWAVLADGSVAIVRVSDFHIDWIRADGTRASTQPIPFVWQPLGGTAKKAFLDSASAVLEQLTAARLARLQAARAAGEPFDVRPHQEPVGFMMIAWAPPGSAHITFPRQLSFISPANLPDSIPPFAPGSTRADLDGNLWIRTSHAMGGVPVYYVIDGAGKLIDRVQPQPGRVIVGFGKGGVVYLAAREP